MKKLTSAEHAMPGGLNIDPAVLQMVHLLESPYYKLNYRFYCFCIIAVRLVILKITNKDVMMISAPPQV